MDRNLFQSNEPLISYTVSIRSNFEFYFWRSIGKIFLKFSFMDGVILFNFLLDGVLMGFDSVSMGFDGGWFPCWWVLMGFDSVLMGFGGLVSFFIPGYP